jgi:hypothetical protein
MSGANSATRSESPNKHEEQRLANCVLDGRYKKSQNHKCSPICTLELLIMIYALERGCRSRAWCVVESCHGRVDCLGLSLLLVLIEPLVHVVVTLEGTLAEDANHVLTMN